MSRDRAHLTVFLALATLGAPATAGTPSGSRSADESGAAGPPATPNASAPSVTTARGEFLRGAALARDGDWVAALDAFHESERLKPHAETTYNIAYCERVLARYVRALIDFDAALALAAAHPSPDDPSVDARRYRAEVEPRIAHVTVTRGPADLDVTVDGLPLELIHAGGQPAFTEGTEASAAALPPGDLRLWLDPGVHVFVATGPSAVRVVEVRTLASGENPVLALELSGVPSAAPRPRHERPPAVVKVNHTPAYVAFAVGGVGLVGTALFGGLALAERNSLDSDPACFAKRCPATYEGRESRMRTYADLATASVVTLGVGAAVGTYFWFTASSPKPSSARTTFWFAGTSAGAAGRF